MTDHEIIEDNFFERTENFSRGRAELIRKDRNPEIISAGIVKKLEEVPEFKEGAKTDLLQHQWYYEIDGRSLLRKCQQSIYCNAKEILKEDLTNEQIKEYWAKIIEQPRLFEQESGYCRVRTMKNAIAEGTLSFESLGIKKVKK